MSHQIKQLLKSFFWFGLVGFSAMMVHFYTVVVIFIPFGIHPLIANTLGFLIAFIISYFGHARLTFHAPNNKNIKTTTGRDGGKFYIQREQMNVEVIARECQEYRAKAEQGYADPLAPIMPDGKLGYKWINLPKVISIEISDKYFGGMPWAAIKRDRTLKAQFYRVVQEEYPAFVTYPGGKLPIPIDVPYPAKQGTTNFFRGADLG